MKAFLALAVLVLPLWAQAAEGFSVSSGVDYSSGKYGGSTSTEIATAFVSARYDHGPYTWKLTVPYLELRGPAIAVGTGDSMLIAPGSSGTRGRVAGPGDLVLGLTWAAWFDPASNLALDVAGKIKLPTADSAKGLGTGKSDEALQLNAYKSWGAATLMASAGYKWMGKPTGSNFRDVAFGSVGLAYRLSEQTSAGLIFDRRQSVLASLVDQQELTLYAAHKLGPQWTVQAYAYAGAGSASPDAGAGASLAYKY